jgi:hypothetical protein
MGTYVETKIVALTSQSANVKFNSTYLSNMRFNLGSIYNNHDDIVNKQVQLLNAQIPYSFYVVNEYNYKIVFKASEDSLFTTAYIPVGNYNGNSLITALISLFDIALSVTVTITLSPINGRITITRASGEIVISSDSTCLEILGFVKNTTYTSVAGNLTPPYALNLLGIKTLQIRSSNLLMSNISSVQGGQTTLLSTIPVDCVPFGMVNYIDKGNHFMSVYNDSLDDLDIDIISGEDGNYINFNNQDWCITLAFHLTKSIQPIERPKISKLLKAPSVSSLPLESPLYPNELETDASDKDIQELNTLLGK